MNLELPVRATVAVARLIAFSLVIAVSLPAKAGLVEYVFDEVDPDAPGYTFMGSIFIDEADLAPSVNLVPLFDSWMFSWTDPSGSPTVTTSSVIDPLLSYSTFYVDVDKEIVSFILDNDRVSMSFASRFYIAYNNPLSPDRLNYQQGSGGPIDVNGDPDYAWQNIPNPSSVVPEPTSIALLGAGVLAFGVVRRKKRKLGE